MPNALSPALEQLIRERLPSKEQIDIVLLLRANRERAWTAAEVSRELATPQESTAMRLFLLASNGMVIFDGSGVPSYRYGAGAEIDVLMQELTEIRAGRPEALSGVVDGAGPDPVRSFADAFRVKR
jgi:hypothetical protein